MKTVGSNNGITENKKDSGLLSGVGFLIASALNLDIKNIFVDGKLISYLPELQELSGCKSYFEPEALWTGVYSLGITNQRVMAVAFEGSFFQFSSVEKYFSKGTIKGGTVLFLVGNDENRNWNYSTGKLFPAFNFYRLDNFIGHLPNYFELSAKLGLPVLVYIDKSVLYEFKPYNNIKTLERRRELKNNNFINKNPKKEVIEGLKDDPSIYSNTGAPFVFLESRTGTGTGLILTNASNFNRIAENPAITENNDIILFNLLNPLLAGKLKEIIKNNCKSSYENIYILDNGYLLSARPDKIFSDHDSRVGFKEIIINNSKDDLVNFCINDFNPIEIETPKTFCPGCNLFLFLHKLQGGINPEKDMFIGDSECFGLLETSPLKYSFLNFFITENPVYFTSNLEFKSIDSRLYIFISSSKFYKHLSDAFNMLKANVHKNITFVVYNSIYDNPGDFENVKSNPMLQPIKKVILDIDSRLKHIKAKYNSPLILIENNCIYNAKSGKNLNYAKYLDVNTDICEKKGCKSCFQLTRCPGIKVEENGRIIIDATICNLCFLCVDLCPHRAIKLRKRKKVKLKKSLESKIKFK